MKETHGRKRQAVVVVIAFVVVVVEKMYGRSLALNRPCQSLHPSILPSLDQFLDASSLLYRRFCLSIP